VAGCADFGTRRARCRSCATNSAAPWCRERRRGSPSRTQRPVADREHRGGHAAAFAVAQQVSPRRTRLAEPVGHGDQLLGRVGAHPDHHQQAHVVLLEANLEVDPVDPHLHVVDLGQRPGGERAGVVLPLPGQPGIVAADNPWLVPGTAPTPGRSRWWTGHADTAAATPRHLRRLPCPGGQDRRRKPASLPGGLVDALVVDPRRPHRDRAGRGGHLPLGVVAVANHQPLPVHIDLAGMDLDVGGHLGSPSRTIASNSDELTAEPLTASRPAPSWTTLTMGVPSRTDAPNAGPDQNLDHFQIISGRCAPPRHLTEGPTSTGSDHCPTESSPRRRRQVATRRREQ
jgi:hypothetical protein